MSGSRLPDWELRLRAYLEDQARQVGPGPDPDWGRLDCATFCAGAVQAVTGCGGLLERWAGYSTRLGALRAIRKAGMASLEEAVASVLGPPVAPAAAHRGDVGLSRDEGLGALGVVIGRHTLFLGDARLLRFPTLELDCAWPVGRAP